MISSSSSLSSHSYSPYQQLHQTPIRLRILQVENIFETQSRSLELGSYATTLGRGKICTFTVVTDLYQCLEQLQIKYYDLLIVHDQTPGLPVYDAMIGIKAAHPNLPVMLISQPSSEPLNFILAKCRQVGFTNVLRCPYTMDDYFFAINNMATALSTSPAITQRDGATSAASAHAQENISATSMANPNTVTGTGTVTGTVSRKNKLSRSLSTPTQSSSSSSPLVSSASSSASNSAVSPSHRSHPLFSKHSHTNGPGGPSSAYALSPTQLHPSQSQTSFSSHGSASATDPLSPSRTTQPLFPPHGSGQAVAGQFQPYPPHPYPAHHPMSYHPSAAPYIYPHPHSHPPSGGYMFHAGAYPPGTGPGAVEGGAHYLPHAMYLPSSSPYPPPFPHPHPHPHAPNGHPYQAFYPSQPLVLPPHYSPMYPHMGPGPPTESTETVRTSSTSAATICPESDEDEDEDEGQRSRLREREEQGEGEVESNLSERAGGQLVRTPTHPPYFSHLVPESRRHHQTSAAAPGPYLDPYLMGAAALAASAAGPSSPALSDDLSFCVSPVPDHF
jgi:hypothetical protein